MAQTIPALLQTGSFCANNMLQFRLQRAIRLLSFLIMENKMGPGHTLLSSTTDHSKSSGTCYLLGLSPGGEVSSYEVMSVLPGWLFQPLSYLGHSWHPPWSFCGILNSCDPNFPSGPSRRHCSAEVVTSHHNKAVNYLGECLRFSKMKGPSSETLEISSFMPAPSCSPAWHSQSLSDVAQS